MNIGIVTIQGGANYGNRLQNYALQEALRDLGHEVATVRNDVYYNGSVSLPRAFAWKLFCRFRDRKKPKEDPVRLQRFREFDRNIRFTQKRYVGCREYDDMDCYVAGSDQVWHPAGRLMPVDLLAFAKPEKRVSYAASFGVSTIPEDKKELARRELAKFRAISVREDAGKAIVEELTGRRDVQVVIDPTMLLTAQRWDRVAQKPEMLDADRYILCYFLGKMPPERMAAIEAVARAHACRIINILDKSSPYYTCNPAEFLYLEKHAFLICTDSFHSSVFAVLYDRPFVVFQRPAREGWSMNSRLDTLLEKLELTGRTFNGEAITEENLCHDYTRAYALLEQEREKAWHFLKTTLTEGKIHET